MSNERRNEGLRSDLRVTLNRALALRVIHSPVQYIDSARRFGYREALEQLDKAFSRKV